jgi:hypothetical protein
MKISLYHAFVLAGFISVFVSCKDAKTKNYGPIVLGDSSTIVTERDPKKLLDLVNDLQPDIPPAAPETTGPENAKNDKPDTTKKAATTTAPLPMTGAGLKAEFKEVTVFIPDLSAKQAGKAKLNNENGAVYTYESGKLLGNSLRITGNIIRVYQKYQSVVVLDNKQGTSLTLESLTESTAWEQLKGGAGNSYPITGLDEAALAYPDADASEIKAAITKVCRKKKINKKKMQELLSSVSHVHAANQKPLTVMLRSVMWKIDGKDEKGRLFSKQIRIDIPM